VLPSEYPEVQGYPQLKQLLVHQVDVQFIDLRSLLELPRVEGDGGCNFAAALLFNIIAGSSVCFYEATPEGLTSRGDRTRRFRGLIRDFYPWTGESVTQDHGLAILYQSARNPLAHSLGIDVSEATTKPRQVTLRKWALTKPQITELEDSLTRPDWVGPTISEVRSLSMGGEEVDVSVPALYWGIHRMLRALFGNSAHAQAAEALVVKFDHLWDRFRATTAAWHVISRRRR
jgi:hypothetical protein